MTPDPLAPTEEDLAAHDTMQKILLCLEYREFFPKACGNFLKSRRRRLASGVSIPPHDLALIERCYDYVQDQLNAVHEALHDLELERGP
jgi:hypothetical protein